MNDQEQASEAELDALLQGRGELASMLAQLPQPESPAALDAAVLADADVALAPKEAANDPVLSPGLMQRYRVPLGIAAMVLIGVNLAGMPGLWESTIAPPPTPREQPVEVKLVEPHAMVPPVMQVEVEAAPAAAAVAPQVAPAPVAPAAVAPAPAYLPPPPPPPPAKLAAMADAAPAQAKVQEAPPAPTAPVAPSVAERSAAPVAEQQSVAVSGRRSRIDISSTQSATVQAEAPQAWLARLERMLADNTPGTWEEWQRFRKAYPAYEVDPEVLKRFEKLAK